MVRATPWRTVALQGCQALSHLVHARTNKSIVAQVAADIGGDDLTIDAIARNEILVLSAARRGRRSL